MSNKSRSMVFDVVSAAVMYGCRVDWVRFVSDRGEHGVKTDVLAMKDRLLEMVPEWDKKGVWKPWRCDKYSGWSMGAYSIGWSGYEYMVEVRSGAAHEFFLGHFRSFSRCTRLDIAYDIGMLDTEYDMAGVLKEVFHESKNWRQKAHLDPVDYEHRVGRGKTWGLGKRSSAKFFRCYDKSDEQGWPVDQGVGRIWRFELECKRGFAQFIHDRAKGKEGPVMAVESTLRAYLSEMLLLGGAFKFGETLVLPYQRREVKNAEKTLAWLNRSVRPAIDKLVMQGYAPDVLEKLDLLELMDQGGPVYGEA